MPKWPLLCLLALVAAGCADAPATHSFPTVRVRQSTLPGLGAGQGVTVAGDLVYLFGDAETGVLREYRWRGLDLVATGRAAALTDAGVDRINHPTGLALRPGLPTFLGNSVTRTREGRICRIDLDRMLNASTADGAILSDTLDDLAVQGARPEYVRWNGRWVIATSDYGPGPNFVRFYDPDKLATAARTSDPGVLLARVPCGPWVQSLHYLEAEDKLLLVQNQVEGRRWRLTVIDDLRAPDYRTARPIDLATPSDELEGYARATPTVGLFLTSARRNNLTVAIRGR